MRHRMLRLAHDFVSDVVRLLDVISLAGPGRAARLALVWTTLSVRSTLGLRPTRGFVVRWRGARGLLAATVWDLSELRVLREVFANGEYKVENAAPQVILDLGSNVGFSVLFFRDAFPDALIVAVEPAAATFSRLEKNVGHLPNVKLIRAAVTPVNGPVLLHLGSESWTSSLTPHSDLTRSEQVEGMTVARILAAAELSRADLIKLDVEGAEAAVLRSSDVAKAADVIVFEFHQEHEDSSVWDLVSALPGFRLERMVGHSEQHPLVTLRRYAAS